MMHSLIRLANDTWNGKVNMAILDMYTNLAYLQAHRNIHMTIIINKIALLFIQENFLSNK